MMVCAWECEESTGDILWSLACFRIVDWLSMRCIDTPVSPVRRSSDSSLPLGSEVSSSTELAVRAKSWSPALSAGVGGRSFPSDDWDKAEVAEWKVASEATEDANGCSSRSSRWVCAERPLVEVEEDSGIAMGSTFFSGMSSLGGGGGGWSDASSVRSMICGSEGLSGRESGSSRMGRENHGCARVCETERRFIGSF